jgi:hypothetical protein
MSINRRTYPPMPGGANWPNADAPDSCYAETPEERAAIERLNVLTRATVAPRPRRLRSMRRDWCG